MNYIEAKRIQQAIAFLHLVIDDVDEQNDGVGVLNVISDRRNTFYHLFYENRHIDYILTFAFDVRQMGRVIETLDVCAFATSSLNDYILTDRIKMKCLDFKMNLHYIKDCLESYMRGDSFKIFYAWQSDINSRSNRNFIESSLDKAIKAVNKSLKLGLAKDRDTKGETGSPDIAEVIFNKINRSLAFVADISFVNEIIKDDKHKGLPNANVMIEYGYAMAVLGAENIITVFNSATGNINDIPFDIKQNRMMIYNYDISKGDGKEIKEQMVQNLTKAIEEICKNRLKI